MKETSDLNECDTLPAENDCGLKVIRYFFDTNEGRCRRFIYQGCPDEGNRFQTLAECQHNCPSDEPEVVRLKLLDSNQMATEETEEKYVQGDRCETSEWGQWSACYDCDGRQVRYRKLRYSAQIANCLFIRLLDVRDCSQSPQCGKQVQFLSIATAQCAITSFLILF